MKILALIHPDFPHSPFKIPHSKFKIQNFPLPLLSLPDSAIVKNGNPVYLPDFDTDFSGSLFWVIKITRLGKNIATRFAERYYSQAAPVILISADNLLYRLKESGLPWTAAIGFDKSVVMGELVDLDKIEIPLLLHTSESTPLPIAPPDKEAINEAVSEVARYNSLKMGDLILIPCALTIPLKIDTLLTITSGEKLILRLPLK